MPSNIRQQGNKLVINGIQNEKGQYTFRAKVTDELGNSIQGTLNLNINGLVIKVEASEDAANQVVITRAGEGHSTSSGASASSGASSASSGSSSTSGSITVQQTVQRIDISSLYENEAGLSGDVQIAPEGGRYPATSPSGEPETSNIVPAVIRNIKAEYNAERDGREITIDEVKRNAAFNRQIAANKAVANLLAIIQQLTANVNAAKTDIILLEKILLEA